MLASFFLTLLTLVAALGSVYSIRTLLQDEKEDTPGYDPHMDGMITLEDLSRILFSEEENYY
jgi:hypothetical protein